jgi:hypothetical protein
MNFDISMLSVLLLPQNFAFITRFDVEITPQSRGSEKYVRQAVSKALPEFDEDKYNTSWNVLALLPRLQKLSVSLWLVLLPPLTDEVCDAILAPIYRLKDKGLSEFHLAAPDHTFRLFRRAENPPYSTISFYPLGSYHSPWHHHWDDSPYQIGRDDGVYFPICAFYSSI